ncbi:MAG: bifunctional phosphopantothenoylcysteine decarboxylase/phosphopantothenate--cysteine ligase CoaBC, partial [Calditrichota bacterium]
MTIKADNSSFAPENSSEYRPLKDRRILLVITGGIAAYKSCQLVRDIRRAGGEVQVLMTTAAQRFVTPLTFATLSGRPVLTDMFPDPPPPEPIHLKPVEWGEIWVVAPASADFIGKLANGLADDLPSTCALAFTGPVLLAPGMNARMWANSAVQDNIARLTARGAACVGPEFGSMAGINEKAGAGRMSEPEAILDKIEELLSDRSRWKGKRVIVTSGPTREPLDPVRFFSNRSSGRMGDAIARQAFLRGAEVTLIRGCATSGLPPRGVQLIWVDTAAEMAQAVKDAFPPADALIMTAAVADWTPEKTALNKLKKEAGSPNINWKETEDILAWAGKQKTKQVVVGFALETSNHVEHARRKL